MTGEKCPCDAMLQSQEQLRRHEEKLGHGNTNFALIDQKLGAIEMDIQKMIADIKEIKEKPAVRWESAVNAVTNAMLLAILAYLLARLG